MFPEGRFLDFLIVGVIALIVVGPKDLPMLMRKVGQFVGKMRSMANEFRASFDELARQTELDELRKEVDAMRKSQRELFSGADPASHAKPLIDDIHKALAPSPPEPSTEPPAPHAAPDSTPPAASEAPATREAS